MQNPTHQYNKAGIYNVRLVVCDFDGDTTFYNLTINVSSNTLMDGENSSDFVSFDQAILSSIGGISIISVIGISGIVLYKKKR